MLRILICAFVFPLLGCSTNGRYALPPGCHLDGDLVLAVWSRKSEYNAFTLEVECPADYDCVQVNWWYTHSALVQRVVRGDYASNSMDFAVLQHDDFVEETVRPWYVSVVRIANPDLAKGLDVEYRVTNYCLGK